MTEGIRKIPLPAGFWSMPRGVCRWCELAIFYPDGHPRAGEFDMRRNWHANCWATYRRYTDSNAQYRFLRKRDGARCSVCSVAEGAPLRYEPEGWMPGRRGLEARTCSHGLGHPHIYDGQVWGFYCRVEIGLVALEVEHTVPLWKVDKTKPGAIEYWGPDNLTLMCSHRCHPRKTAREAAERAKEQRLAGKTKRGFEPLPI